MKQRTLSGASGSRLARGRNLAARFAHTWKTDSASAAFRRAFKSTVSASRRDRRFDEVDVVCELLAARKHGVMVDVGAHHGNSFGPLLHQGWKVFAFEPDRRNRAELEAGYGSSDGLEISPMAVHNQDGLVLDFFQSEVSSGISGLSAFDESHSTAYSVRTTTLKTFLNERGSPLIDFLKVDAEGFDLTVLQGFDWEGVAPSAVIVEFEDAKTLPLGHDWRDIAKYLADRAYFVLVSEWKPIEEYGQRHEWRSINQWPCDLADSRGWGNLVAFQDEVLARRYLNLVAGNF